MPRVVTRWLVAIAAAVLVVVGGARPASAFEYEIYIDIDDEDDLLELLNTDQIEEDTYNTLLEVLRRGTSLETASREDLYVLPNLTYEEVDAILAYRDEADRIGDPANLVVAGAITRRKLAAIAPFILVPRPPGAPIGADGQIRYQMVFAHQDNTVPPMYLQARVNTLRHLTVGFAGVLDRGRVNNVAYDPSRDALSADPPGPRVRLPKYFAQWETDKWGVIAGTYRIGFGQRLTFDTTDRYTPNGFYLDYAVQRRYDLVRECTESAGELDASPCEDVNRRIAPDYAVREGQQGLAIGAKHLPLPQGWLQTYGWFSFQPRSLYQYQIRDVSQCPDPTDDSNAGCSAPFVFHRDEPLLDPQSRFSFETLPNMYSELLGGGNFTYFYDRRTHVGVTGYGAKPVWLVQEADLDFQDWARNPYNGAFGAVGADFAWGRKFVDLFGEFSRSFDNMDEVSPVGGGGNAAVLRNTYTLDNHEIELSARYYDRDFANPFAGPIAAPDVRDGLRARDEAGGRVRYNAYFWDNRVSLRTFVDFWGVISEGLPRGRVFARTDVQATDWFRPGLWLEYQRRDLRPVEPVSCFETTNDERVQQAQCGGQRFSITGRSRFDPHKRVYVTLQYRHDIQDNHYELGGIDFTGDIGGDVIGAEIDAENFDVASRQRQDINGFFVIGYKPIDKLRLRTRWRWFWEDITDNDRFEHSIWGYLDAAYTIRPWAIPRLRYDLVVYLDGRDSTANRPNPEHWFLFEFTSRF